MTFKAKDLDYERYGNEINILLQEYQDKFDQIKAEAAHKTICGVTYLSHPGLIPLYCEYSLKLDPYKNKYKPSKRKIAAGAVACAAVGVGVGTLTGGIGLVAMGGGVGLSGTLSGGVLGATLGTLGMCAKEVCAPSRRA